MKKLPEQFKLGIINSNVESMRSTAFGYLQEEFQTFVANPHHYKNYFKYKHDKIPYFAQVYASVFIDNLRTPSEKYLNFNIKMNDDGFMFMDPDCIPGSKPVKGERHQCKGWYSLTTQCIKDNFPALRELAQDLLDERTITYHAAYYNFQEEMLDVKFGTRSGVTVVFTFERYMMDIEMLTDKWNEETENE